MATATEKRLRLVGQGIEKLQRQRDNVSAEVAKHRKQLGLAESFDIDTESKRIADVQAKVQAGEGILAALDGKLTELLAEQADLENAVKREKAAELAKQAEGIERKLQGHLAGFESELAEYDTLMQQRAKLLGKFYARGGEYSPLRKALATWRNNKAYSQAALKAALEGR